MKTLCFFTFVIGICTCLISSEANQKLVIPELKIQTDVRYRFAETKYALTIFNPSKANKTYIANIPFPKDALVKNFTLEIDGKTYLSRIVEDRNNKESKRVEKETTQEKININQLQNTNAFRLPIIVPPSKSVRLVLTYHEVLKRVRGLYTIGTFVVHCTNVYNLHVQIAITEESRLTRFNVLPAAWPTKNTGLSNKVNVRRLSNKTAHITYKALSNKQECLHQVEVIYDVERSSEAGEIIVEDEFFVHFLAPTELKAIPKDIVFVLDTSSSMSGTPIRELQKSMITILEKLAPEDRFNILVFQTTFGLLESELQNVSKPSIKNAKNMIKHMSPSGATNIHDALLASIKMLHTEKLKDIRSPIILFLTGGHASVGVKNRRVITKRVQSRNTLGIPIVTISLGQEADQLLTTKLSAQNFGYSRHILDITSSSLVMNNLYDEVASTLMKNLHVIYTNNVVNDRYLTRTKFRIIFKNAELVISGKLLNNSTSSDLNSTVIGLGANGLTILSDPHIIVLQTNTQEKTVRSIWQYNRIKEVMMLKTAISNPAILQRLDKTLLTLAIQYDYVTPQTTLSIDTCFNKGQPDIIKNSERVYAAAFRPTEIPPKRQGSRFSGKGDPHFEVTVEGIEYPLCFDISMEPYSIIQILHFPGELIINIGIIPESDDFREDKMYISDIFIWSQNDKILLNIDSKILYNGMFYNWSANNCTEQSVERLTICINGNYDLIEFKIRNTFCLLVRKVIHQDRKYFNILINDVVVSASTKASGLLANILRSGIRLRKVVNKKSHIIGSFRSAHQLQKKPLHLVGKLKMEKSREKILCWHLHKNVTNIFGKDFFLRSLFHSGKV